MSVECPDTGRASRRELPIGNPCLQVHADDRTAGIRLGQIVRPLVRIGGIGGWCVNDVTVTTVGVSAVAMTVALVSRMPVLLVVLVVL